VLRQSVITHSHLFQADKTIEIDPNMQSTASNTSNASYGSPSPSEQQSFKAFRPGQSVESRIPTAYPVVSHLSGRPDSNSSTRLKSGGTSLGQLSPYRKRRVDSPSSPYEAVKSLKGDRYPNFLSHVDSIMDSIYKAKAKVRREVVDPHDECCSDEDCPEGRCYDVQCKDGRCSDDECSEQDCLDEDCSEVYQLGGGDAEGNLTHDNSMSQATSRTYSCPTRDEHYRD